MCVWCGWVVLGCCVGGDCVVVCCWDCDCGVVDWLVMGGVGVL